MSETPTSVRVGVVQMRSGVDIARNVAEADALIGQAVDRGAQLVVTPEATNILQRDPQKLIAALENGDDETSIASFADIAKRRGAWLLVGSLMVSAPEGRAANRSHLYTPEGKLAATYDKIHLFDVALGEGDEYRESRAIAAGDEARISQTPWGPIGLTVCYDLRFPHLHRALARAGATMIAIPAAFTRPTGEAHWEVLLRARAIECGAFVLAAAQGGRHEDGRSTWGRSMIIGPWGEVLAAFDHDEPGVLVADLDLAAVTAVRTQLPSLGHDREFARP